MESCTLDELKEHFESEIEQLTRCMDLAAEVIGLGLSVSDCREQLVAINSELCVTESVVGRFREHVKQERQQVEEAKVVMDQLAELKSHIGHTQTHLPERLPGLQKQTHHNQTQQADHRAPLAPKEPSNDDNTERPSTANSTKPKGFRKQRYIPQMEYLTIDEFNSIPKYMKGRLAYNSVNNMVDGINLTLTTKYDLMHKTPSKLSGPKAKKYHKYKEQENKNTKGLFFFIDDDFKTYSKVKYDNTARSIITILRHLGRLREIRGGGFTRFAVL